MAWFWFPGCLSGLNIRSLNFGIGGKKNVQDGSGSPELSRKLEILGYRLEGRDQTFWVATEPGRQVGTTPATHSAAHATGRGS